jgi:hypothetical protein
MKLIASTLAIASMTLIMPFAFASQAQCNTDRPYATMTASASNIKGAEASKDGFCRTLDKAYEIRAQALAARG